MNLWERIQTRSGGGGLWDLLEESLPRPDEPARDLGIWLQVSVQPGGLWREARDETLILTRAAAHGEDDIWQLADEETLILKREGTDSLWEAVEGEAGQTPSPGREPTAVWEQVADETLVIARPEIPVWSRALKIRDLARYKPVRALGWALKQLETARGEEYWVLKNLRTGAYLRLTGQQVYLWHLLDGSHSVPDLAVENFLHYQTLSVEWLMGFLAQLQAKGFLAEERVDVYQATGQQLWRRGLAYWGGRLVGLLFRSELSIKGVDRFYSALYKSGGRLLFARPVLILIWLVSLAGLPAFFYVARNRGLSVVTGAGDSLAIGLVGLLAAEIFAVFVHESAHALTTRHYGRTVRRGGVGLYFGMVAFFVDTTDIWLEPRGPRLAVTWAGPFSGFFLGGLASLALLVSPATPWAGLAYQFATFCYGISILNLNPLLKLDGYYLLMDWLEMPMLRERSLAFARQELWGKLRRLEKFSRQEKIFAVFGILALAWTAFAIFSVIWLYGGMLFGLVQSALGAALAWAILALVVGCVAYSAIRWLLANRRLART